MKIDNKKEIYSFDVEVEEPIVEEEAKTPARPTTAKKTPAKKKEPEKTSYRIFIAKPTRRQTEEAELEYSIEISNCLKKGVLTKAMLLKKYDELTGGDQHRLKKDLAYLNEISTDYALKFQELQEMKRGKTMKQLEKNKEYAEATAELIELRKEIVRVETEYSSLFDFTADNKAANRQILWYLSNLTYFSKDGEEEWNPLVPGESWEEQRDYLYDEEENPTDLVLEAAFPKSLTFVSLWYHSIAPETKDFEDLNRDIDKGTF